mgnify:CR=1 FL=1
MRLKTVKVKWLTEHLKRTNMIGKEIVFRDPVVENVVDKFVHRSDVGFKKYGRTLDTERKGKHKDLAGYLNDIQEELMDAVLYIQAAREELADAVPPQISTPKYHVGSDKVVYMDETGYDDETED